MADNRNPNDLQGFYDTMKMSKPSNEFQLYEAAERGDLHLLTFEMPIYIS